MASGLVTLDDILIVDSATLLCSYCLKRMEIEYGDDGELLAMSVAEAQLIAVAHIREVH